jgi:hypothetical protein
VKLMELMNQIYEAWGLEKKAGSPDYIVGLGSGVLADETGKPTQASRNVVAECLFLFGASETQAPGRSIILIGGQPWKSPPFSDAELMHQDLLNSAQSTNPPTLSEKDIILLKGNNTHEQVRALRNFLGDFPDAEAVVVCPRMQSRRLRAILRRQGLLERTGIATVDDACEARLPVERFRWSTRRYLAREMLACIHHKLKGWI